VAYERGAKLQFIEPGKPIQNAFIESFNGRLREEYLNERLRLARRRAHQNRKVENPIKSGTAALGSRPSNTGGVRGKESGKLGDRAHGLASRPSAGRRGAMRSGLGSKT
jgi:transposase InsO family protein